MSRTGDLLATVAGRFPRVSGDEPDGDTVLVQITKFSPRERG